MTNSLNHSILFILKAPFTLLELAPHLSRHKKNQTLSAGPGWKVQSSPQSHQAPEVQMELRRVQGLSRSAQHTHRRTGEKSHLEGASCKNSYGFTMGEGAR